MTSIYYMKSVNVNDDNYILVASDNGRLFAYDISDDTYTALCAAGTLSASGVQIAQWQNSLAIIVDPVKGYFTWDETTFQKWNGALLSLTITAAGTGYTSSPTIGGFSTGGGSGGSATADIGALSATIGTSNNGYFVGEVLTVTGGTAVAPCTFKVTTVDGSGAVTAVSVIDPGDYTVAPANPASTTGGSGGACTLNVTYGIVRLILGSPGSGYVIAPTLTVTGGGGSNGAVTAKLAVVPDVGEHVAVYEGRVWVSKGRTVFFSAPGAFNDFSTTTYGGNFTMEDETLHSAITQLISANNFLYIFGVHSIDVVSDVQVVSSTTTFTKTNVSANIGTVQSNAVDSYYRGIWFVEEFGVHALYGATTQKTSDALDGVFRQLDVIWPGDPDDIPANPKYISSGLVSLFNQLCVAYLLPYIDPDLRATRSLLALFFNKKWFFASATGITFVCSAEVNGQPALFGTDGTSIYNMFEDFTVPIDQKIQTKLWSSGDPLSTKQSMRSGLEMDIPGAPNTVTVTVDTEHSWQSVPITMDLGNIVNWINNSGVIVPWTNNAGGVVYWMAGGFVFDARDYQTDGRYLGMTITTNHPQEIYIGFHMEFIRRARWTAP